ncbi:MAG TPA: hypothetical protein VFW88_09475 [Burkholderiales bacterium]|jgi:hypothetical protein|nr:hypothetical protein [Burkholderiales bacterium]
MRSLKRTLYWTAAPVLVTASLGFAGAAFAASGSDYGSGSSSGNISHAQGAHGTNQSAGAPSETAPMSPECKSDPSSPKCTEEPHSSSGMSGSESGSMGHGSSSGSTNGESGAMEHSQPPGGDTSQMKPAVPQANTPAVRNGAAGNSSETPNSMSK